MQNPNQNPNAAGGGGNPNPENLNGAGGNPNPQNLNGAGGDNGRNPNPEELNEAGQIREAIRRLGERTDNQIAQLMLMITGVAGRLPNPNLEQPPYEAENPQNPKMAVVLAKITQLEQSVARSKKIAATGFDINKLCLFLNAKLPEKFRPIDFTKFDGTGDPKAHLTGYIGDLSMWGVEKDAMAQMFSQTLVGRALHWFTSLDETRKRSWEDICATFIAQYDYNIQLVVTTRELESTKMESKESFVKRWRAKAAQMKDRPSNKDQIRMIV